MLNHALRFCSAVPFPLRLKVQSSALHRLTLNIGILVGFVLSCRMASAQVPTSQVEARVLQQIQSLNALKAKRTPIERKIDSQLLLVLEKSRSVALRRAVPHLQTRVLIDANNQILVEVSGQITSSLTSVIKRNGGIVGRSFPWAGVMRARLSLSQIEALAALPSVNFIRPASRPFTRNALAKSLRTSLREVVQPRSTPTAPPSQGDVVSEGDVTHEANVARSRYGVTGAGIKIGVLSDSVDYLEQAQESGELPDVTVLAGQSGNDAAGAGEGTAMLEIVHDLAPGAQLYFATAYHGIDQFAKNIRDLRGVGCDIIVDDVGYLEESPFQPDTVAQAVQDVVADGALYFSAAGNAGNYDHKSSDVWDGNFRAATRDKRGVLHNWGRGTLNALASTAGVQLTLQWSDPLGASKNDYDLYLVDDSGQIVNVSNNSQNGKQDPYESFDLSFSQGRYVVAALYSGQPRYLHLVSYDSTLSQITPGAIGDHNAVPECISVAAVYAYSSYPAPFNGVARNPVETYSSDGPRRLFYGANGKPLTGSFLAPGGKVIPKPDIAAADGVTTSVPGFTRFFGTSAAAPHAAAIAALVKSFNPSLNNTTIRRLMTASALDIEQPGFDRDSGYGIVNARRIFELLVRGDKTAPSVTITTPVSNAKLHHFDRISGTVRDNAGGSGVTLVQVFVVRERDGRYWSGKNWSENRISLPATLTGDNFAITDNLPNGSNLLSGGYLLFATATDRSGNQGTAQTHVTVPDETPPSIFITGVKLNTNGQLATVQGVIKDDALGSGPESVVLFLRRARDGRYWNGTEWVTTATELTTTLSDTGNSAVWQRNNDWPTANDSAASELYYITAIGYDNAHNRATATTSVVVRDTGIPVT